jgi:hypothetical protein
LDRTHLANIPDHDGFVGVDADELPRPESQLLNWSLMAFQFVHRRCHRDLPNVYVSLQATGSQELQFLHPQKVRNVAAVSKTVMFDTAFQGVIDDKLAIGSSRDDHARVIKVLDLGHPCIGLVRFPRLDVSLFATPHFSGPGGRDQISRCILTQKVHVVKVKHSLIITETYHFIYYVSNLIQHPHWTHA